MNPPSDDILTLPVEIIHGDAEHMTALRALGHAEIVTATDRITPAQEILFAAALFLLLERPKPVDRAVLAEVLWPGADDQPRQHRLRQTLLQLKRAGIPLQTTRQMVSISREAAESDLDSLFLAGAGEISRIETLQFLPGYAPRFSRAFSDWLDIKRAEISAAATRGLLSDLRQARSRGDWMRAEQLALKCMDVDPFNEEAVLARAEASAMRGAKREAVAMLDRYVADLGPGSIDIKLPATLMRKRIAERVPEAAFFGRTENIFVGREHDMQVLITLLNDSREARGRCCLLWGDAGIGKSRLAAELGRFGELQGVRMRRVACRRGDIQRPLSVFVEMIPQLLEMRGALGCSAETISDLHRLTEFDIKSPRAPQVEMDPQSIFEAIRAAIFDLIDAVADEQPLLLVIEDVHWLDAASARILGQLADLASDKCLLLVFTSRIRDNPLLDACTRAGLVTHHVAPFTEDASTRLVHEMFDATNEKADEDFVSWCREIGEGNPFFLHELVRQWIETRQRHVVPPSITSVIRDRVSRLSETATQVLQACSILGEHATLPRIEKMLGHEPYRLLAALQELAKGSMLSEENGAPPDESVKLRVRHDLVSAFVLERLDKSSRKFLHRRAGEALEQDRLTGPPDTALMWASAHHWQSAGESDRAYGLAKTCAEHLLAVGLPEDAVNAIERARKFTQTDADDVALLRIKVDVLEQSNQWHDLIATISEIRAHSSESPVHDDLELIALAARWKKSEDTAVLLSLVRECVQANADTSAIHRRNAASLAMKIAADRQDYEAMDDIWNTFKTLPAANVDDIAALELELVYSSERGDKADTVRTARNLVLCATRHPEEVRATRALVNAASALRNTGDVRAAVDIGRQAIQNAVARRCYASARSFAIELIRTYLVQGDLREARAEMQKISELGIPNADTRHSIDYLHIQARLCLEEGRIDEAAKYYSQFEAFVPSLPTARRGPALATAVRIGAALQHDASVLLPLVTELERIHLACRRAGAQDYEAYGVYVGLCAVGKGRDAATLLSDYVTTYRTSRAPLPEGILQALEAARE